MKRTPAQKSELKIEIIIGVIFLLILSAVYCFSKQRVIYTDLQTGTEYRDCGKHSEVVFSSGEVLAYGNEKTEYENGEIGEWKLKKC